MTQNEKQILNDLGRTNFGQALRVYLEEKKREIGDISASTSWEDTKARQLALKLIKELFAFMEDKVSIDKMKNPYV